MHLQSKAQFPVKATVMERLSGAMAADCPDACPTELSMARKSRDVSCDCLGMLATTQDLQHFPTYRAPDVDESAGDNQWGYCRDARMQASIDASLNARVPPWKRSSSKVGPEAMTFTASSKKNAVAKKKSRLKLMDQSQRVTARKGKVKTKPKQFIRPRSTAFSPKHRLVPHPPLGPPPSHKMCQRHWGRDGSIHSNIDRSKSHRGKYRSKERRSHSRRRSCSRRRLTSRQRRRSTLSLDRCEHGHRSRSRSVGARQSFVGRNSEICRAATTVDPVEVHMEIVARHVARAGRGLEGAIRKAVESSRASMAAHIRWRFLTAPDSAEHEQFQRLVASKQRDYANLRREPASEHEVNRISISSLVPDDADPLPHDKIWISLRGFEAQHVKPYEHCINDAGAGVEVSPAKRKGPGQESDLRAAAEWLRMRKDEVLHDLHCLGEPPSGRLYIGQCPPGAATVVMAEVEARGREDSNSSVIGSTHDPHVLQSAGGWVLSVGPPPLGTEMRLPIEDLFFAHDNQSERFRAAPVGKACSTVLQTTLELWSGHKSLEQVPQFSVVWHEGRWHVRTGNRRLMAWRLLRLYAPERFREVEVLVAETTVDWVSKRYSAAKNSPACQGAWIKVRETGEFVGRERASFGQDLLRLICTATTPAG